VEVGGGGGGGRGGCRRAKPFFLALSGGRVGDGDGEGEKKKGCGVDERRRRRPPAKCRRRSFSRDRRSAPPPLASQNGSRDVSAPSPIIPAPTPPSSLPPPPLPPLSNHLFTSLFQWHLPLRSRRWVDLPHPSTWHRRLPMICTRVSTCCRRRHRFGTSDAAELLTPHPSHSDSPLIITLPPTPPPL
jgi:hypothetical protein